MLLSYQCHFQPISRQYVADGCRFSETGEAHGNRAVSEHHLLVYCAGRKRIRPERPQPYLGARTNTRLVLWRPVTFISTVYIDL